MKKIKQGSINSDKQIDTFLFCEKVKQKTSSNNEDDDYLMSKEELKDLQGGLKVLNLEDDEDISHHNNILSKIRDINDSDMA